MRWVNAYTNVITSHFVQTFCQLRDKTIKFLTVFGRADEVPWGDFGRSSFLYMHDFMVCLALSGSIGRQWQSGAKSQKSPPHGPQARNRWYAINPIKKGPTVLITASVLYVNNGLQLDPRKEAFICVSWPLVLARSPEGSGAKSNRFAPRT